MHLQNKFVIGALIWLSCFKGYAAELERAEPLLQSPEIFEMLRANYIEEFAALINHAQLERNSSYTLSSSIVSDSCTVLMSKDNFMGRTGAHISQVILKHNDSFPNLMNGRSVNRYCSKYGTMNVQQKALVWVLILTVIAHFESSCNQNAQAKGPNGTAYGYYQQHAGREEKYDGDMNICRRNDSRDPLLASQCTLSMLEFQFQKNQGELFNNNSYWDVLRPNGYAKKAPAIQRALTQFSLCQPKLL